MKSVRAEFNDKETYNFIMSKVRIELVNKLHMIFSIDRRKNENMMRLIKAQCREDVYK